MNQYLALKTRHREEMNAFPIKFAFNSERFAKAMRELGLDPAETDKVTGIGGGGFMLKTDVQRFKDMTDMHIQAHTDAMDADKTGEGYIYDAIHYELGNYEYGYTGDDTDALDALCITRKQVTEDSRIAKALSRAKQAHREWYRAHG